MLLDLLNLLYPKVCLSCKEMLLQNEKLLCLHCLDKLPFTKQCYQKDNEAYQKFYGRVAIEHASCLLYFKRGTNTQNLFHNLKYRNHPEISYFLGKIFAEELKNTNLLESITSIVPVPIHRVKKKKRGYNQVDGFADALSETFNLRIEKELLLKITKTRSKASQSLFERLKKQKEDIVLNHKIIPEKLNHFLLIDDILTTGSTLEKCARELLKIPNTKITILCLAMTTKRF